MSTASPSLSALSDYGQSGEVSFVPAKHAEMAKKAFTRFRFSFGKKTDPIKEHWDFFLSHADAADILETLNAGETATLTKCDDDNNQRVLETVTFTPFNNKKQALLRATLAHFTEDGRKLSADLCFRSSTFTSELDKALAATPALETTDQGISL
tara:strand:+ start:951 stop:1412 length:462 start_codon:yes stop_codon:yes gene_type:complete